MTDIDPDALVPDFRSGRGRASAIWRWIDPEENPSGVVYGTIAVGAVLASESTRRETFAETVVATMVILGLYWVAHTYAVVVGRRLETRETLTARRLWRTFLHEGAIVKGAAIPIAVLLVLWTCGVGLDTAVNASLWTSAGVLSAFEIVAALRGRASGAQKVVQVLVGTLLGAGILVVRLLLH
ncbi:MAG TPA: hypothetical protein VNC61_07310 [Acidimicrobiales bacterium]|nr:hypothetical protein [Acidimicrobiales bacterium]